MLVSDLLKLPFVVVIGAAISALLFAWAMSKADGAKKLKVFLVLAVVVFLVFAVANAINFSKYGKYLSQVAKMYPAFQGKSCLYGDKGMACYDEVVCDFRRVENYDFDTSNPFNLKTKFLVENIQGLVVVDGVRHLNDGVYPVVRATIVGRTDFIISEYSCPEPIVIPEYTLIADLKMGAGLWFGTFFWTAGILMLVSGFTFLWLYSKRPWLWTERVFAFWLTIILVVVTLVCFFSFGWLTMGKLFF